MMQTTTGRIGLLRIFAAMSLCLALGGCAKEDASQTIARAREALQDISSMSYDMTVDISLESQGETLYMTTTAAADYILQPLQMKLKMTTSMNGTDGITATSYLKEENDVNTLYTGLDLGSQVFWQASEMENTDSYTHYNARDNLELYLSSAQSFVPAEEDSGDGTLRYDGLIAGEALDQILDASGIRTHLEDMGFSLPAKKDLTDRPDTLPISIWIETATGMPVKYEMDLTSLMQALISDLIGEGNDAQFPADLTVNKMYVSMTIRDINHVDAIEIPKEALDALSNGLDQFTAMEDLTEDNYQSFFAVASDMGYQYLGRAYCKAPAGMFEDSSFLDAFLPYGDDLTYTPDGLTVTASAHGMEVLQTALHCEGNAQSVVDQAYKQLLDSGLEIMDGEIGETQYDPSLDIAYKQIAYLEYEDNIQQPRVAILYADHKQQQYYLYAKITYMPEQFDEQYPAMLEELRDAFALTLPQYTLSEFY